MADINLLTECVLRWAHETYPGCDPLCVYNATYEGNWGRHWAGNDICMWGYPIFIVKEEIVEGLKSVSWPPTDLTKLIANANDPQLFPKLKEYVDYYKEKYVDIWK